MSKRDEDAIFVRGVFSLTTTKVVWPDYPNAIPVEDDGVVPWDRLDESIRRRWINIASVLRSGLSARR